MAKQTNDHRTPKSPVSPVPHLRTFVRSYVRTYVRTVPYRTPSESGAVGTYVDGKEVPPPPPPFVVDEVKSCPRPNKREEPYGSRKKHRRAVPMLWHARMTAVRRS